MASDILKLTRLTYVPRWAIVPMARQQSVAEHSYRVALICIALAEHKGWSPGAMGILIREALTHDSDEIYTGDVPATAKYGLVSLRKSNMKFHDDTVPPIVHFIVKVADVIEAITWFNMYCQANMRSSSIAGSMRQTLDGLKNHPDYDHEVYNRAIRLTEITEGIE